MVQESERLSLRTKLLLALGQGVEGIWITVGGYYVNKFFLETCCLEPALVGLIQLGVGLFDAFNDTLIGALSDRTNTRWGRRRPWLLFGGPFLAASYVAVWNALPLQTPQELKMLYYTFAYMAVSIGLTSVRVQISALLPELTNDYNERTVASGFNVVGANVLGLTFAVLHSAIVGTENKPSSFLQSAAICASAILLFTWTVFCGIKERYVAPDEPLPSKGILTEIAWAMRNKSFCYVTLMYLAGPTAVTLTQTNIALFCKYVLRDESILMLLVPVVQGTGLFMIPVWVFIANKTSKKHIYLLGGSMLAASMVSLNFVESLEASLVIGVAVGMSLAVPYLVPISMLPDVVEEDEELTGRRREGVLSGLFTTALKLSVTAGSVLTNLILEQAGYVSPSSSCTASGKVVSTVEPDVQPPAVLQVMRWLVGPIPAMFILLAMFAAWRFPITPEVHAARMARRAASTAQIAKEKMDNVKSEPQEHGSAHNEAHEAHDEPCTKVVL
ncbi:unnamed protein product [Effrenium voratum]|uniref:Uncharacterized protein n=1 Tax=Effrenium voratum TaxID=2562239 RepID=A0AA36MXV5_9DINO|nr:unnamed protein product [Effrenium voratum]CAJ1432815.1 unnamed protein product [Effrenium voratum]